MVAGVKDTRTTALISLEPRQVMLEKQSMKKKEKKNDTSETLENGFSCETPEPKHEKEEKKKTKKKNRDFPQMTSLLLQSIASYLASNGFSKTLSALRSEAPLEVDGCKGHSLDLEAACRQYLETSEYPIEANTMDLKEQDSHEDVILQNDVEPISKKKKKKKKSNASDGNMETNKNLTNGVTDELYVENKEKKNKAESKTSKSDGDNSQHNILLEELPVKSEGKRKKGRLVFDSLGEDIKQVVSETFQEAAEKADHENQLAELPKKSKVKKGKDKSISDSLAGNIQQDSPETLQKVIKEKSKHLQVPECVTESFSVDILSDETNGKLKDKRKKKKEKSLSTDCGDGGDLNQTDSNKLDVLVSEENVVAAETKGSKKRKRAATEETDSKVEDENASKGSEPSKITGSKERKKKEQLPKEDGFLEDDNHPGKKRKAGINEDCSNQQSNKQLEALTDTEERPSAHDSKNELDGLANGNLGKIEKGATPKTSKERGISAEPKTVNSFQRVKVEEVKFVDERLQDNSYWAKDGADIGYGARAQEVLGQVKGRDFRHEKTKKKRGSYRGGQIDLQSHSIKFNYSDEDE